MTQKAGGTTAIPAARVQKRRRMVPGKQPVSKTNLPVHGPGGPTGGAEAPLRTLFPPQRNASLRGIGDARAMPSRRWRAYPLCTRWLAGVSPVRIQWGPVPIGSSPERHRHHAVYTRGWKGGPQRRKKLLSCGAAVVYSGQLRIHGLNRVNPINDCRPHPLQPRSNGATAPYQHEENDASKNLESNFSRFRDGAGDIQGEAFRRQAQRGIDEKSGPADQRRPSTSGDSTWADSAFTGPSIQLGCEQKPLQSGVNRAGIRRCSGAKGVVDGTTVDARLRRERHSRNQRQNALQNPAPAHK